MAQKPVSETTHGLAVPPGHEILSIQLRPDGLSFAHVENGALKTAVLPTPADHPDGLRAICSAPEWPKRKFDAVRVCVPTDRAILIPAELDCPGKYDALFSALGYPPAPDARILALACGNDQILLHTVQDAVIRSLTELFGESLAFYHPLSANLGQPESEGTVIRLDEAAGYGNYTVTNGSELLLADVFPLNSDADLLLQVNRLVVAGKLGSFRIVCSGDRCQSNAETLARHYRQVELHPDGENRNLYHPMRCE